MPYSMAVALRVSGFQDISGMEGYASEIDWEFNSSETEGKWSGLSKPLFIC